MKISKRALGEIADVIAGQSPPSNLYNKTEEGIPFYQGKADFGEKYPITRNWCTGENHKEAIKNDILLSVRAPVGPVNLCNTKSIIGRGLSAIRVRNGYSYEFLYYYLKNNEYRISKLGTGSTFKAITQKQINDIVIPVPDIYEDQIRIATVFIRVENLIAKRKESIKSLDDLLKSTFIEMFGDPVKNEKGWELKTAIDYADCIVPGRDKPKSFSGGTPWVMTDDLANLGFTEKSKLNIGLSGNEIKEVRARVIPRGSIIITCVGDLGVASLANTDIVVNQQLHTFQCHNSMNNIFFMYAISFQKAFMYRRATKTTVPYMNKSVCNSIPMICPPLPLQNQFAAIVRKVESIKARYQAGLTELENLYGSLSQRAFKGELDLSKVPVDVGAKAETAESEIEAYAPEVQITSKFSRGELIKIIKTQLKQPFSFEKLWRTLQEKQFEESLEYEAVKGMVFDLLEGDERFLSQGFDDRTKDTDGKTVREIVLRVNI